MAPSLWLERFTAKQSLTEQICTECGHAAVPLRQQRGRDDLEINLWLGWISLAVLYAVAVILHVLTGKLLHGKFYFPPGMIVRLFHRLTEIFLVLSLVYTVWRMSTGYHACPKCLHDSMIPIDSPRGQRVKAEFEKTVKQ